MSTKLTKEQNNFVIKFTNELLNVPGGVMELSKDEIGNYKDKEFTEINNNTVKILEDYIDEAIHFNEEEAKIISNTNVKQSIIALIFNLVSLQCQSTFNKRHSTNRRIYFDEIDWDTQNLIIYKMKEYAKKMYI